MCSSLLQPSISNDIGSLNNTVTVKKSDFEVFEALALDSVAAVDKKKPSKSLCFYSLHRAPDKVLI